MPRSSATPIKTLKRGQIVGVPTAGAVVSTGAAPILDVGTLRLPTHGWFTINDGEDIEKNGPSRIICCGCNRRPCRAGVMRN
jgi:hypothetical protein